MKKCYLHKHLSANPVRAHFKIVQESLALLFHFGQVLKLSEHITSKFRAQKTQFKKSIALSRFPEHFSGEEARPRLGQRVERRAGLFQAQLANQHLRRQVT